MRCKPCLQRNRVASTVGAKAIRCGRCKEPLATPYILERLEKIKNELVNLERKLSWFTVPSRRNELRWAIEKQTKILKQLPDYPGYRYTRLASEDVCIELEIKAERLRDKLDANVFASARWLMELFLDIFKRSAPAIMRGTGVG